MPTGYTYQVESGEMTELAPFVMTCARAFGALVMMRDEPLDAPIPDAFLPSEYATKRVADARAELDAAMSMTIEQAAEANKAAHAQGVARAQQERARTIEQQARYAAMRAKVVAWTPPTDDHAGLKAFMLEQIDTSARHPYMPEDPAPMDAEAYMYGRCANAAQTLARALKDLDAEVQRARERTEWVRALRESLA